MATTTTRRKPTPARTPAKSTAKSTMDARNKAASEISDVDQPEDAVEEEDFSNVLSFEQIQEADDITEFTHPVPEWKGSVVLKSITQRRMNEIMEEVSDLEERGKSATQVMMKHIVCAGMHSPEIDENRYEVLLDKSASAMMGIMNAILDNSHLSEDSRKRVEKSLPR